MKKYIGALSCAVAILSIASADVLFQEDFQTPSISGNTPISTFGWANDIAADDNRVFSLNAVWSWAGTAYTEAFYTTVGMGAGFTAFDLSSVSGLKLSVKNHSTWAPEVTSGYFALQLDGTSWYVSAIPVATPTAVWTIREMTFDPTAYLWNTLTVSGTGSVGAGGATIGPAAASDLAGTVTGVGFVIDRSGNGTQNFDDLTLFTPEVSTPPAAPSVQKIWMNGTTAKLYWGSVVSSTNYIVKISDTAGGPYIPVADTTNTTFWVTNLVVGTTNYFVISAENSAGEGDPSSEVSGVAQNFSIIADSDISWGDWLFEYKEAAFDGDTGTFYQSPNPIGSYVGVDLGEGNERVPLEILYYPTAGKTVLLQGAEFQGSNDNLTWDTLITINAQPTVEWHSVYPEATNAYRYIRLWFADGDDLNHGTVAEIAFGTNVPAFHEITVSPADGESILGPANVMLSAEIVEWDSEFASAELYLNGTLVASDNTPSGDGTNLISHAAGELAIGTYTGKVIVAGINPSVLETNTWTFTIIPTPSPTALALWNINMAGSETSSYPVPNGTVIAAPDTGANQWNNLVSPALDGIDTNEFSWLPTNALSILDADGANPIGLKWSGSSEDWRYVVEATTPTDELFKGYFGSAGFDSTMEISGLDPAAKYDIYVYFTWQWNENWVTYNIMEGTGEFTNLWFLPERDNVTSGASYGDLVRGENYVVFTKLAPSPAGNIQINATSADGGWSGLQIAKVPSSGPTMVPDIQSITVSGGSVNLTWASETGVQYRILRKTSLPGGSWTAVKSGISGNDPSTSDSVSAGGTDAEFYKIEGQ